MNPVSGFTHESVLFRTVGQYRRWSTVRSLSANSLGIGRWSTPLTNGAPFTNIFEIEAFCLLEALDL
jgi:hypothetical protein